MDRIKIADRLIELMYGPGGPRSLRNACQILEVSLNTAIRLLVYFDAPKSPFDFTEWNSKSSGPDGYLSKEREPVAKSDPPSNTAQQLALSTTDLPQLALLKRTSSTQSPPAWLKIIPSIYQESILLSLSLFWAFSESELFEPLPSTTAHLPSSP